MSWKFLSVSYDELLSLNALQTLEHFTLKLNTCNEERVQECLRLLEKAIKISC